MKLKLKKEKEKEKENENIFERLSKEDPLIKEKKKILKDLFNGKGKYRYENGDEYDGDFENGIRKGKGIYKQKNGFIFEGIWDNDVPNGFGKINLNEKIIKCNFHNGKLIEKPVDEDGLGYFNIDYNFYNQCMKLSGQRLLHLENPDVVSSIFKADSILSFLEE